MTTQTISPQVGAVTAASVSCASRVRRGAFGMVFGLMIQFTAGMLVNLFTKIPDSHPGSNPPEYFTGSGQSLIWAITQSGLPALMFHATWGLFLMVVGVGVIVQARKLHRRAITVTAVLGFLFVLGAGFNGASFLNYREDFSSMIMASLFALAVLAYVSLLFVLPAD
jgi:hypothetical protein